MKTPQKKDVSKRHAPPEKSISAATLAKRCDITPRQVQRLTLEGIFDRSTDEDGQELKGRYPELSTRNYCRYLRKLSRLEDASENEHNALKIRKTRAEAEIAEQRAGQIKGQLYHAADIEFAITAMITYLRQGILAIPSSVSRKLIGKKNFKEVYEPLMGEIVAVLNKISKPDREMMLQLSAARLASQGVDLAQPSAAEATHG